MRLAVSPRAHDEVGREGEQQSGDQEQPTGDHPRRGDRPCRPVATDRGAAAPAPSGDRPPGAARVAAYGVRSSRPRSPGSAGSASQPLGPPSGALEPQQERSCRAARSGRGPAARAASSGGSRRLCGDGRHLRSRRGRGGRSTPSASPPGRHRRSEPREGCHLGVRPARGPAAGSWGCHRSAGSGCRWDRSVGSSVGSAVGPATTAARAVRTCARSAGVQRRVTTGQLADLVTGNLSRAVDVVEEVGHLVTARLVGLRRQGGGDQHGEGVDPLVLRRQVDAAGDPVGVDGGVRDTGRHATRSSAGRTRRPCSAGRRSAAGSARRRRRR